MALECLAWWGPGCKWGKYVHVDGKWGTGLRTEKHNEPKRRKMGSWCGIQRAHASARFFTIILDAASQFLWPTGTLSTSLHAVTFQQVLRLIRVAVVIDTFQNVNDLKRKSAWGEIFDCNMNWWEAGLKWNVWTVLGLDWTEMGNGLKLQVWCDQTACRRVFFRNVKQQSQASVFWRFEWQIHYCIWRLSNFTVCDYSKSRDMTINSITTTSTFFPTTLFTNHLIVPGYTDWVAGNWG
jgi:hypothetical protein